MSSARSFHTVCQEEVYGEVKSMLGELSDEFFDDAEHCDFYLKYGTTVVEISIEPYEEDNAVVEVLAYCVQGVKATTELMRELLRINAEVPMGAFSMVDGDIFFSHSFVGRDLQASQLLASLNHVAATSDMYDEQIVARYGGETALERLRGWSRRTRRAEAR
ncbi:MAG TPA: YbjN domain-containing protein [Thermoanaerobaculia bacterium]|nr:YbjN domain-containing protein [Thermoanaerobaculia bacterium]